MQEIETAFKSLSESINNIDIKSLPSIKLTEYHSVDKLTTSPAIYFIYHDSYGLMYIGKAVSLRKRFYVTRDSYGRVQEEKCHDALVKALQLKNCTLYYLVIKKEYITILESILLQNKVPLWNKNLI